MCRLVLLLSLGPFLDGFFTILSSILVSEYVHQALQPELFTEALLAVSFMGGTFFGSGFVAQQADQWGRQLFIRTLLPLCIPCLLVAFYLPSTLCYILSLALCGILVGADQPVALALLTEMSPETVRERNLSAMMTGWYIGALVGVSLYSVLIAWNLSNTLFFLLGAMGIALFIPGRYRLQESHAWQGQHTRMPLLWLIQKHGRSWLFCFVFWLCQTIPVTILMIYAPDLVRSLVGDVNPDVTLGVLYTGFFLGTLPMNRQSFASRPAGVLLLTAITIAFTLWGLTLSSAMSAPVVIGLVALYAIAYGMQSTLDYVFPNILFPTYCRAYATGTLLSATRLGSLLTLFLFPWMYRNVSITYLLIAGGGIALLGGLILLIKPRKPIES